MIVDSRATTGRPDAMASATSGWTDSSAVRPVDGFAWGWAGVGTRETLASRTRVACVGPSTTTVPYPGEWEADVVLRDGGVAHVRPIRPEDAEAVQRFHAGQSAESIYLRFFAPLQTLSERDLKRFTEVDYVDRVALVATVGERIVGIARYDRTERGTADVAFNVADSDQGRGLGLGAARAPGRRRTGAGGAAVPGRRAAAEPADARGLRRGRVRDHPPLRRRRDQPRLRHHARPRCPRRSGRRASTQPSR